MSFLASRSLLGLSKKPMQATLSPASIAASLTNKRTFIKTIPQPPGYIVGTVNDAYVPPKPSKVHGSRHWTFERLVSVGLVPLTVAPFAFGSITPFADSILSVLLLIHSYTGFQSCIIDYIPKRVYGWVHGAAMGLLSFGSAVSLYGIYVLESNDIGLTSIFMKLWY